MCLLSNSVQLLKRSMHSVDTAQAHTISNRPLRWFGTKFFIFYTQFAIFCNQHFDARAAAPDRDAIKNPFHTPSMRNQGKTLCRRFDQIRIVRSVECNQDADAHQIALFAYARELTATFKKDQRGNSFSNSYEWCSRTRSTSCARWRMMARLEGAHNSHSKYDKI